MSYGVLALIVNGLFALILVIGFLIGFWRGLKKSSVNFAFAVIGAIVAFFITIPVTNAVLGIKITDAGVTKTLNNFFLDMILDDPQITELLTSAPALKNLIYGLPAALVNIVMFILLNIAVQLVIYIIYKVIAIAFLRNKKPADDEEPVKKRRLLGGLVGVIKTLVLAIFALLPLSSLMGLADEMATEQNYFIEQEVQAANTVTSDEETVLGEENSSSNILIDKLPTIALDSIKAYHNSAFGFLGGIFHLDDAVLDYYANVEIENENVKIRAEVQNFWKIYDAYSNISKIGKDGFDKKFVDINFDKLDPVIEGILKGGLYRTVVTDLLKAAVTDYNNSSIIDASKLGEFTKILDAVSVELSKNNQVADYFAHDINLIYQIMKELCKADIVDQINQSESKAVDDILKILVDDNNYQTFNKQIVNIFDLNMIRAGAKPVADILVSKVVEEAEKVSVDTSAWTEQDWETVAVSFADLLNSAFKLMDEVDIQAVLGDPLTLLDNNSNTNLQSVLSKLGRIIDNLRTNPLLKADNKPVIDSFLTKNKFVLPDNQVIDINGNKIDVQTYSSLFNDVLYPSMNKIKTAGMYEIIKSETGIDQVRLFNLVANQDKNFLSQVILPLYQVEPTKTLLVDELLMTLQSQQIDFSKLTTYEMWANDLAQIGELLQQLKVIKVTETQNAIEYLFGGGDVSKFMLKIDNATEGANGYLTNGQLSKVVSPMLNATSTNGLVKEMFAIIANAVGTLTDSSAVTISSDEKLLREQNSEICDIMENFLPIYKEYDLGITKLEQLNKENVGMLMDALKVNKYRASGNGVFEVVFDKITQYLESKYGNMFGNNGDYSQTNFKEVCSSLPNLPIA